MNCYRARVIRRPLEGWISLQADAPSLAQIEAASGIRLPSAIGMHVSNAAVEVFRTGPDDCLLRFGIAQEADMLTRLRLAAGDANAAIALVSDASVGFDVIGEDASLVLAQGCPLDLDGMPADVCARTLLGRVPMLVARIEGGFALWVERSHASHVQAWLEAGAAGTR